MSARIGMVGALVVLLALAGCARQEPAKAKVAPTAPAAAPKPMVGGAGRAPLPDYAAQAKAQTEREQSAELKAKAAALKIDVPAKQP